MGDFTFQVACLRLLADEPLFGFHAVPVDWPVLRQDLRIVADCCCCYVQFQGHEGL